MSLAVLGTGSWGSALAITAARNSNDPVYLWGRDADLVASIKTANQNKKYLPGIELPSNIVLTADLEIALAAAKSILVVLPSFVIKDIFKTLAKHLSSEQTIAWATKGLAANSTQFIHEHFIEIFGPKAKCAVLSGPSFAKEVANGIPTAVTIAANNQKFALELRKYFHSSVFRVYINNDLIGVQLGGVVKNALAVACGIASSLKLGANSNAALITRGLAETVRLGRALGADANTLYGLAGMGDIVLTCTDDQSRNRRFGKLLGQGYTSTAAQQKIGQVVEAVHNVSNLLALASKYNVSLPIIEQVNAVLQHNITPAEAMQNLLTRLPVEEFY